MSRAAQCRRTRGAAGRQSRTGGRFRSEACNLHLVNGQVFPAHQAATLLDSLGQLGGQSAVIETSRVVLTRVSVRANSVPENFPPW